MRIWFRGHRGVSALLLAAMALAGTAGVLLYYVDWWLTLPLLASLSLPSVQLEPSSNQTRVRDKRLSRCRDSGICQSSVSSSALSRYGAGW